jgi:hypothetical protein
MAFCAHTPRLINNYPDNRSSFVPTSRIPRLAIAELEMIKSSNSMVYFFVKDYRQKFRFFSSDPEKDFAIKTSRTKEMWKLAQKKLLLLPQRILSQEQAFIRILKLDEDTIQICHSGCHSEKRIKMKFSFFLHKQRSKHILLLIGETFLLPISGLAALLPGPNVFFAALALVMITHWRALRGLNHLARKKHEFLTIPLFSEWEEAVALSRENRYSEILTKIAKEHNLPQLQKILWK